MNNVEETIQKINKYVLSSVSDTRYEHSVRTAQTAKQLCKLYNEDEQLGYLAGIAHDMCKEMKNKLLFSLASQDGDPITEIEQNKPSLLHGRAASVLLKQEFGITDKKILEAVKYHTFGNVGMSDFAKILYIADKIEPGRPHVNEEYMKQFEGLTLNEFLIKILEENINYLKEKGKLIAENTNIFLKSLKE